jgi:RNA polymerase sigma-70 factor, ECF subfamily
MARKSGSEDPSGSGPGTSPSLLDRAKLRAPGAWERLVEVYTPLVYRWCRRAGVRADDAPDVVQEVFLAVATHIDQFHCDQPGDTFRGWLWTITRHKTQDFFRSEKHQAKASGGNNADQRLCLLPGRLPSVAEVHRSPTDDTLLAQRVVELIRPEVEYRTWQAFWRLTVDGQSGLEVAAELGMSLRAVYQAKYRVLQRIRQESGGLPQDLVGAAIRRPLESNASTA